MAQQKKMNFSTGSGIAQYPWLTKPDYAFDSERPIQGQPEGVRRKTQRN